MVVMLYNDRFVEYVETAVDQWQVTGAEYRATDFLLLNMLALNMTSDGLHIMAVGSASVGNALVYASRARVEDRFSNPVLANPFFGSPSLFDPHLLSDCTRFYFVLNQTGRGVYYVDYD